MSTEQATSDNGKAGLETIQVYHGAKKCRELDVAALNELSDEATQRGDLRRAARRRRRLVAGGMRTGGGRQGAGRDCGVGRSNGGALDDTRDLTSNVFCKQSGQAGSLDGERG